jgi:sugar phosphate isomerase/epimerase
MIDRRKFLQNTGALALGGFALSTSSTAFSMISKPMARPVGVQLYTVMTQIDKDLDGTLKKIASIGYREVESAFSMKTGFYGLSAKEFAAKTKSLGLAWKSNHTIGAPFKLPAGAKPPVGADGKPMVIPPMKNLLENRQEIIDSAAEGGVEYLVCSFTPLKTTDEIKQSLDTLQKTAEGCKKAGITFAYHNHTQEFEMVDGKLPYDMILSQISADILKLELDLGWATVAGADPVELFKKSPGRFPLWHVKDINKETKKPTEVGNGYVDFKRIFEAASTAGLKHIFVEQDGAPDPLANIELSFKNLEKIKGA